MHSVKRVMTQLKTAFTFVVSSVVLVTGSTVYAQAFNGFDLSNALIDKQHLVQGGPPRDGIPAISQANYIEADEADFLQPKDVVLGVTVAGKAFAYPRHIMNWHEIVNERIDDKAFVVTYCPLCGSGLAFSAQVNDRQLNFGVSGLLYNNDLLFYDRETESLWSQIERRAISGNYAGAKLEQLYMEHTSWQAWRRKHPDTVVLSDNQGFKRNYRHDPYTGYETSSQVFFKTLRTAPSEFHNKEKVLGLNIGDASKAYPFSELRKAGEASFIDTLNGFDYRVLWDVEADSATIESMTEQTLTPTVAYWFAWYNFYPSTEVFRAE